MIRRGCIVLVGVAMGCGLLTPSAAVSTFADNSAHFSNIGVGVSGSTATYYLCIVGAVAPLFAGVTATDANGNQYSINGSYNGQSCGTGTYLIVASAPNLGPGSYQFLGAQGVMSDKTPLPPALRDSAFISMISSNPDTVAQDCPTLDFTVGSGGPTSPQDCHGSGTAGSFATIGTGPTPVPMPTNTPVATNTPTALPTNAPTPAPPVPTSAPANSPTGTSSGSPSQGTGGQPTAAPTSPVQGTGSGPSAAATATPISSGGNSSGSSGQATAAASDTPQPLDSGSIQLVGSAPQTHTDLTLRVTPLSPLVRPGDAARFRISYLRDALLQANLALPGQPARSSFGVAGPNGRLILAVQVPRHIRLSNGRARARVVIRAVAGAWQRVAAFAPALAAGDSTHLAGWTIAHSYLRVVVSFPGRPARTSYQMTDGQGRYAVDIVAPPRSILHRATAVAHVAIWALTPRQSAQTTTPLAISDMVVTMVLGRTRNCIQKPAIQIGYLPNTLVKIVASVSTGRLLTFKVQTDAHGDAVVQPSIAFSGADSPAHISVLATATSPGGQRTERITASTVLPQECRNPGSSIISVGP